MDTKTVAVTALTPKDYKSSNKPVWCPGCGDFAILSALTKALAGMQLKPEDVAVISGIGCSSRIPAYVNAYGFHGVHGRALPLATGLKVSRPDLQVIVTGGDGDGFSIGGNHFLHACRRNADITYIVMDNRVYGMTKGQASPTTESDWEKGKLTPDGPGINPFHPLLIALASGANFISRAFSGNPNHVAKVLVEAMRHPGFSFVQVLSPCVTFRPEHREWKELNHDTPVTTTVDPGIAARRLMVDDGLSVGVFYKGNRPVYQPDLKATVNNLTDLDREFIV